MKDILQTALLFGRVTSINMDFGRSPHKAQSTIGTYLNTLEILKDGPLTLQDPAKILAAALLLAGCTRHQYRRREPGIGRGYFLFELGCQSMASNVSIKSLKGSFQLSVKYLVLLSRQARPARLPCWPLRATIPEPKPWPEQRSRPARRDDAPGAGHG